MVTIDINKRAILIALFNSSMTILIPDKFIVSYLMTKVHYFDSLEKKESSDELSTRAHCPSYVSSVDVSLW